VMRRRGVDAAGSVVGRALELQQGDVDRQPEGILDHVS
jgi:hypothetical protein